MRKKYWLLSLAALLAAPGGRPQRVPQLRPMLEDGPTETSVRYVGGPVSQRSGQDIGAQINAAYASLPPQGGSIVVLADPAGRCYDFITPIVAATPGKYVLLESGALPSHIMHSPLAACLNYLPTNATSAITLDYAPPGGNTSSRSHGVRQLTLTNNRCETIGGCGSDAAGISVIAANGASFDGLRVIGFGAGISITSSSSGSLSISKCTISENVVGFLHSRSEGPYVSIDGCHFQGNGTAISSAASLRISDSSIVSSTVVGITCSSPAACDVSNDHFENIEADTTHFLAGNGVFSIVGGDMRDDRTSGDTDWWMNLAGATFFILGTALTSNGRTATNVVVANSQGSVFLQNNSAAVLKSLVSNFTGPQHVGERQIQPVSMSSFVSTQDRQLPRSSQTVTTTESANLDQPGAKTLQNEVLSSIDNVHYVDGVKYRTISACYASLQAGGTCRVPPGYHEEFAQGKLILGSSKTVLEFEGPATLVGQIVVPAGTHGVSIITRFPMSSDNRGGNRGVMLSYSGAGAAINVGDSTADTLGFTISKGMNINLAQAQFGASGLRMTRVQDFTIEYTSVILGNAPRALGFVLDGSNNYTGNGTLLEPKVFGGKASDQIGILGSGLGPEGMNAVRIVGGHLSLNGSQGTSVCIDIEAGGQNLLLQTDCENAGTALRVESPQAAAVQGYLRAENVRTFVSYGSKSRGNKIITDNFSAVVDHGRNNSIEYPAANQIQNNLWHTFANSEGWGVVDFATQTNRLNFIAAAKSGNTQMNGENGGAIQLNTTSDGGTVFYDGLTHPVASIDATGRGTFNALVVGGGAALRTSGQSGTGDLCMTTNCELNGPTISQGVILGPSKGSGVQGGDSKLLTSGTITGSVGTPLCLDEFGGATTKGCHEGSSVQSTKLSPSCVTGDHSYDFCVSVLTWPNAFTDANYSVTCSGLSPSNPRANITLGQRSTRTVSVNVVTYGSVAVSFLELHCIGIDDHGSNSASTALPSTAPQPTLPPARSILRQKPTGLREPGMEQY